MKYKVVSDTGTSSRLTAASMTTAVVTTASSSKSVSLIPTAQSMH